ncbi:MAG TPA: hypothetical protein VM600_04855, partial [Actinomycetota bacterium]|nr:hypothetical protein [Actinomycetota bacterium]
LAAQHPGRDVPGSQIVGPHQGRLGHRSSLLPASVASTPTSVNGVSACETNITSGARTALMCLENRQPGRTSTADMGIEPLHVLKGQGARDA